MTDSADPLPPASGQETDPASPQPGEPAAPARLAGLTSTGKVRSSSFSAWWAGLIIAAVVLVLLLIFILQNSRTVTVRYLWFDGRVSLAVALLLAAIAGLLLVAIPGSARILQLRRALKKNATGHSAGRRRTTGRAA